MIEEAASQGARKHKACQILELSPRSFERWKTAEGVVKEDGRLFSQRQPAHALTEAEKDKILSVMTSKEFCDCPPHQVVPILADRGEYIASESSFYRLLKEKKLDLQRGKAKRGSVKKPKAYIARAPNEIWSWDITYLARDVKGTFFYLYMIMDIFSRKIVGYAVHDKESSEHAAALAAKAYHAEGVNGKNIILHSDNGSPMKGATMLSTLHQLGVTPSFSRPSVSNDNPYSESLFKTMKYCPEYPSEPFKDKESAQKWVDRFVGWYNEEHCHSCIKFVSPQQRHAGLDKHILEERKRVYQEAKERTPARWSRGIRNWDYIKEVFLNPGKSSQKVA